MRAKLYLTLALVAVTSAPVLASDLSTDVEAAAKQAGYWSTVARKCGYPGDKLDRARSKLTAAVMAAALKHDPSSSSAVYETMRFGETMAFASFMSTPSKDTCDKASALMDQFASQ